MMRRATTARSGRVASDGSPDIAQLVRAIRRTPIVDNHAHPLLKPQALGKYPLESIVTEAGGDALGDVFTSLAHARAVQQLSAALGCAEDWAAIVAAIEQRRAGGDASYHAWVDRCLAGVETILVDDGLDNENDVYDCAWHDRFTRSPCKRIVRIEAVAAQLIDRQCAVARAETALAGRPMDAPAAMLKSVLGRFDGAIRAAIADPAVAGFKSVICYRTGLDVAAEPDWKAAEESLYAIVQDYAASRETFRRVDHAGLNDLFVHRTATMLRESALPPPPPPPPEEEEPEEPKDDVEEMAGKEKNEKTVEKGAATGEAATTSAATPPQRGQIKPLQFHTGLGDNDITLAKSSPAHLQPLIRAFPTVPIVLLHSGYPFMRESSYLATVYANVYADIGEVFPFISRHGQEAIVREIFELCPWSKVIWSTDGHWFPETYILATDQVREVLETVLVDFVQTGALTVPAAIQLTRDILFNNSNKLYNLGLAFSELAEETSVVSRAPPPPTPLSMWDAFLASGLKHEPAFVRIAWLDYTALPRMRMVPFRRFDRLVRAGLPVDIGITKACLGLLQNDMPVPGVPTAGEYRLHPDWSSLKAGPIPGHVTMYGDFREAASDGASSPTTRALLCPRSQLVQAVERGAAAGVSFLVGFEVEFVLLLQRSDARDETRALPGYGHAWSASRFFADPQVAVLLADMVAELDDAGIEVEQVHPESAQGQFEIVLPPRPPVAAVDTLLLARDIMAAQAVEKGYQFTLHPKPFRQAGTGSHVHLSFTRRGTTDGPGASDSGDNEDNEENEDPKASDSEDKDKSFYAGILAHLPSLVAFTYSHPVSYERVLDSAWAGGTWVTWGVQNRETPLRQIAGNHWELKCMDGLANPYLALAALLTAGLDGMARKTSLAPWKACAADPASLTARERAELGITTSIPRSLGEALAALRADTVLQELLGPEVVKWYINVKESEMLAAEGVEREVLDRWIMKRY